MVHSNSISDENPKTLSLTSKVARSAQWVFAGRIAGRLFELIKAVILARLLSPDDFGLFGLVMLAVMILDVFSHTGMNAALIQRKDNIQHYLDTAWTVQLVRGLLLASFLFLAAPAVAWFFDEPRIIPLLRVISSVPVLQGFVNIGILYFEKEFAFHKQFAFDIISASVSLLLGIILAFVLRSVWALIWANIGLVFIKFVLSYVMHSYRPRFRFVAQRAKELFRFGKWMSGYAIVSFGWQQLDKLVLGKILGPMSLGLYQVAQRIADLPVSQIAIASINFIFPAYSKIQAERERLGNAFLDVFETILSIVIPLSVFIFLAAPDIVYGLLGAKWKDAILPLRLLSIVGLFRALEVVSTPLFISAGKPAIEFWKNTLKLVVMGISIVPMTLKWGIVGTCFSLIMGSIVTIPVWIGVVSIVDLRWPHFLLRLLTVIPLGISSAIAIIVTHKIIVEPGVPSLLMSTVNCMILFLLCALIIGKTSKRGIYIHFNRIIKGLHQYGDKA